MSMSKKVPKKNTGKTRCPTTARFAPGRSVTVSNSATSKRSTSMLAPGEKQWITAKPPVQVFEKGIDVTPLPLLYLDPMLIKKHQSTILEASDGTPTDPRSSISAFNKTGQAVSTLYTGGPFTRSVFSQSEASDSYVDDIHESATDLATGWTDIQHLREVVIEVLTDHDLEKDVTINLTETPTMWLLDQRGVVFMEDEESMERVKDENVKYMELKKTRVGNDLYMEREMNTFNEPPKFKTSQTTKIGYHEVGVTATTWDMYDTYQEEKGQGEPHGTDSEELDGGQSVTGSDGHMIIAPKSAEVPQEAKHEVSFTASDSMFESKPNSVTAAVTDAQLQTGEDAIFSMPQFHRDLFIMERAVNLNTYQNKQALYRGFPLVVEQSDMKKPVCMESTMSMPDMGPHVDRLWSYFCPLTKGHNVSCIAWNKVNPDLLAVGYGQFEFNNQKTGLVCCWSLKNPNYPERIFTSAYGVTSLDFSRVNPNYLAAGLHNGGIVIYNVHLSKDETIIDSFDCPGKHNAPVWHIQWINRDRSMEDEKSEVLVSVSTDGRVTQWSIRKGFEQNDLMKLKRLPTRMQGKCRERKGEAYISRYAGGFSFDFHPHNRNVYLVGTEDSFIHKCSCSYIEQYLETYTGHNEPVYKIKWSQFEPQLFLSCSADWSMRLWHQERQKAVLVFHSSTKSVYDICWSPTSSTVFACVNEEAVEVWDLNVSILDPIIKNSGMTNAKMTCVCFANNSESIVVGDSDGQVTVFQLKCMPSHDENASLMKIVESSLANQLSSLDIRQHSEPIDQVDEF